jgi:hypothetical protein
MTVYASICRDIRVAGFQIDGPGLTSQAAGTGCGPSSVTDRDSANLAQWVGAPAVLRAAAGAVVTVSDSDRDRDSAALMAPGRVTRPA